MHSYPGKFVVVDGLDGVGKGVVLDAIVNYHKHYGRKVLDLQKPETGFWIKHRVHPTFTEDSWGEGSVIPWDNFDVLVSAEPTFAGIGAAIRNEVIAKNGRDYSAHITADLYSLDRLVLYKKIILPALERGKTIIQSRSVSTSIVYQPMQKLLEGEQPLTIDDVLALEGNRFALEHAPDALIIPTVKDVDEVMRRLAGREKDDDCEFENPEFQRKIKPLYEGEILRDIFESRGTSVMYLDAGISIVESKRQAVEMYLRAQDQC